MYRYMSFLCEQKLDRSGSRAAFKFRPTPANDVTQKGDVLYGADENEERAGGGHATAAGRPMVASNGGNGRRDEGEGAWGQPSRPESSVRNNASFFSPKSR